jgi:hypothetical protein
MCEIPQLNGPPPLQSVGRAPDAEPTSVEKVGVDHRRADIRVAEQLLNGSNVIAVLEQVGRKRMTEGVAADSLRDPGEPDGCGHGALNDGLVQMVPRRRTKSPIAADTPGRKQELPDPVGSRVRILPIERRMNHDAADTNYVEAEGLRDPVTVKGRLKAIKRMLGDLPVSVLEKPSDVLRFKAIYRKGREIATVNRALATLRAAINWGRFQDPPYLTTTPFHRFGVNIKVKEETNNSIRSPSLASMRRMRRTAAFRSIPRDAWRRF